MLKLLIVEDVTLVAERIASLARRHFAKRLQRLDVAHHFEQANMLLGVVPYDLVFLDLNLNGRDGFELLGKHKGFKTIVITANESEAARAFDLGIFDFIRKPLSEQRFGIAMARFEKALNQGKGSEDYLRIKTRAGIEMVKLEEVNYIQAARNYTEVYLKSGPCLLHDHNLNKIQEQLPEHFRRIHRSYITNLHNIKRFVNHGAGKYEVVLHNEVKIPINRDSYQNLARPK